MERKQPGVIRPKGAAAQAFNVQTMAHFVGLVVGPLWGGFINYRYGWETDMDSGLVHFCDSNSDALIEWQIS